MSSIKRTNPVPRRVLAIAALLVVAVGLLGATGVADALGPRPQATITSNGWTTSASAPATAAGSTVTMQVLVTSSTTRTALVDVEVYGASGRPFQQWLDNVAFTAGTRRTLAISWSVPAAQARGPYTVKIGVFGSGWTGLLHWNDSAAVFNVTAPATSTTVKPTTTTVRPTTSTTAATSTTPTTVRPTTTTVRSTTTTSTTTTTVRPTTTTSTTSTTVRPTTTTTVRPTTTTVVPGQRFVTLPVGATLPSDAQCAAAVRRTAEVRPDNATANQTRGYDLKPQSGLYARVTGDFVGTTDEIIQWAACKWGLDEDIVRAQTAKESWWHQSSAGDFSSDPTHCATGHPIGADGRPGECAESVGLMQVRFPYWTSAFPSATYSSAYNIDMALAARRNCFEGNETWLNTVERGRNYAAGDLWGCVGLWFSGRWYAGGAVEYTQAVQDWYNQRIWETPGFKAG